MRFLIRHQYTLVWLTWLVILVAAFYARTVSFEFACIDDDANLRDNPFVNGSQHFWESWLKPYFNLYIPVSYSFWRALVVLAGGLEPWIFHAANALLHGLNVGLVFLLFRQWRSGLSRAACAAGALVFALHPLQVETVAWVSGARDLLATLGTLLALLLLLRSDGPRRYVLLGVATLTFTLALLSKPVACIAPIIAVCLAPQRLRQRSYLITIGIWLVFGFAAAYGNSLFQPATENPFVVVWSKRPLVALGALGFYTQKLLWPIGLAADYGLTPVRLMRSTGLVITGSVVAVWALRSRGVLMFVVGLLPTLGFVPFFYQAISATADRYVYLAMLGPALIIATWWDRGFPVRWFSAVLLSSLAACTWLQMQHWSTRVDIARRMVAVNADSWFGYFNWGTSLLQRGDAEAARHYLEASVRRRPWFPDSHYNLAIAAVETKDYAAAEQHLRTNLYFGGDNAPALIWLGHVLALQGKFDEAGAYFRRGLKMAPNHPGGRLHYAQLLRAQGKNNDAFAELELAQESSINDTKFHALKGELLLTRGENLKAIESYEKALALGSRGVDTYANLGVAYLREKDYERAEEVLSKAIAIDPYMPEALHGIGLVYEATGRRLQAVDAWTTASAQGFKPAIEALRRVRKTDGTKQ